MSKTTLVITSIASANHPVLRRIADEAARHDIRFILIGDTKSPADFSLPGCDFYSIERQHDIEDTFSGLLPVKHYARKNLGYLRAIQEGAEIIIETDDDNIPDETFWAPRHRRQDAHHVTGEGWINVYRYFTSRHVWPRGFPPDLIQAPAPGTTGITAGDFPVQQGLANGNPDVDAIFRLVQPGEDILFDDLNVATGKNQWCPFNSQNTTWFREAFPLMYLPSYCSFRMTDIWRSLVAQRVAWTCGWDILFHKPTVFQERNVHNLMKDFEDEIPGYLNNHLMAQKLQELDLPGGPENINANLLRCYDMLIGMGLVGLEERELLTMWTGFFGG